MIYTGVDGSIGWSAGGPRRSTTPTPRAGGGALTGVVGSIRWHYYTAAGIHGYTVSCSTDGQWRLSANVVLADSFKMAQTPLTFCALRTKHGLDGKCVVKSEWRWPILLILERTEHALTARLGPPEEEI